jgi:hypothetical protein
MSLNNVSRLRIVCGINYIDTELVKDWWPFAEFNYPITEFNSDNMLISMEKAIESCDTTWYEYYVPSHESWYKRCELPDICLQ